MMNNNLKMNLTIDPAVLNAVATAARQYNDVAAALEQTDVVRQLSAVVSALNHRQAFGGFRLPTMVRDVMQMAEATTVAVSRWKSAERQIVAAAGQMQRAMEPWVRLFQEGERRDSFQATCVRSLAEHGWFVAPDRAWTLEIVRPRSSDEAESESWRDTLASVVRARCADVEEMICVRYPNRAVCVREAFWAHGEGKYSLSIPGCLIQADGIWAEHFGVSLYGRTKWDGCGRTFGGLRQKVVAELSRDGLGLWLSQNERPADFGGLNRHRVVHGEDVAYASELNSLQAISLLEFVCWFVSLESAELN